jgi:renal tumor antigen
MDMNLYDAIKGKVCFLPNCIEGKRHYLPEARIKFYMF